LFVTFPLIFNKPLLSSLLYLHIQPGCIHVEYKNLDFLFMSDYIKRVIEIISLPFFISHSYLALNTYMGLGLCTGKYYCKLLQVTYT
jgi:hypothetical protein